MSFIKMRIVNSAEFDDALIKCQMAFGFISIRKKTLVWLACFDELDAIITREQLEIVGSKYAGRWSL